MPPNDRWISPRAQLFLLWLGLTLMFIYGFALWVLLGMVPPPPATWSASEVAAFYVRNGLQMRVGAMIASWTSAFMVPIAVVVAAQMARLEKGIPIWSMLQLSGGILMSIFLVLPPLFFGVAAFNPARSIEATALMHEYGVLTLVTTDQFFIFQNIAIVYICLRPSTEEKPVFPRWLGYLTAWATLMFEVGAVAFLPKTGPFAWNGLFVFWLPLAIFGAWLIILSITLMGAIKRQRLADA